MVHGVRPDVEPQTVRREDLFGRHEAGQPHPPGNHEVGGGETVADHDW